MEVVGGVKKSGFFLDDLFRFPVPYYLVFDEAQFYF